MAIDPSAEYPGQVVTGDPGYPFGKARNVTVSGDGTGTPWEQRLANDILGFQQALLAAAGVTPSGVSDKVGASDYLDALTRLRRMDTEGIRLANTDEYDTTVLNQNIQVVVAGPPNGEMAVVVGASSGEIGTSHDASTFTLRTPDGSFAGTFRCGAANATMVVLAGSSAEIQTSTNASTWTTRTPDGAYAGAWSCAAFGNGVFVLMGEDGEIQTSPDGIAWTTRTPPAGVGAGDGWRSVHFDGTRFIAAVALGEDVTDPAIAISADGFTWALTATAPAAGPNEDGKITSCGPRIIVCSVHGGVHISDDDGATWTPVAMTSSKGVSATPGTIHSARGILVAMASASSEWEVYLSLNGLVWVTGGRIGGATASPRTVVYAADRWIAGRNAGHVIRSLKAART
jgi:hypothetical protein